MIAKCSLVRVFLKAVPGSVQHTTAVDSMTKVPIISGKELKSMKNDLQFRSRTPFMRLAVKSDRSRDRELSRLSLRKVKPANRLSVWVPQVFEIKSWNNPYGEPVCRLNFSQ